LCQALAARGWAVVGMFGRTDDLTEAAAGVDVLVVATPDDAVAEVAAAVRPDPSTVVLHLSGSLGLDALAPHPRRAALHPLVPLPTPKIGAARLGAGVTFAVAGDPVARAMAEALGGRAVEVADADRAAYHAAASIAANHVVALLGLTRAAVDDVERLGPRRALTGPAVRGDFATLARHRDALAPEERPAYNAGVGLALQLAGATSPEVPAPAASEHDGARTAEELVPPELVEDVPEVRVPLGVAAVAGVG
jgi:predicted short-subunit dehydrogenase-like oxidoreductase (DUF2520 family)